MDKSSLIKLLNKLLVDLAEKKSIEEYFTARKQRIPNITLQQTEKCRNDSRYLRINDVTNAVDSLLRGSEFIDKLEENIYYWKWAIITLHSSLYGFAIVVCAGSNWRNVTYVPKSILRKRDKKGEDIQVKDHRLIDFWTAIKCSEGIKHYVHSQPLRITSKQEISINWLHDEFRNSFEHFIPTNWSINLYGVPNILIDTLDVIHFLAIEGKNIHYKTKAKPLKIERAVRKSIQILKKSKFYASDFD